MEKTQNVLSSVVLKKTLGEKEKTLFRLNRENIIQLIGCFVLGSGTVFSGMSPFGLAFYTSVFKKEAWILNYVVSIVSVMLFASRSKILYIAALSLVTVLLAVFDTKNSKWKAPFFSFVSFFSLKAIYIVASGVDMYNVFDAFVEAALVFISTYICENSLHLVVSVGKRSFISVKECICTMAFFAILSLSFADYDPIFGFTPANVISVFLIYVFSLGGISGGSVVLGVLLGAVGSLKAGSFSDITSTFAFGALLGAALSSYGRVAVVLGFVIANTTAAFVLSDSANVVVGIYDSIAASVLFFLLPDKYCNHISSLFKKSPSVMSGNNSVYTQMSASVEKRLEQMSRSLYELKNIYSERNTERVLGRDYLTAMFNEVTSSACRGCSSKSRCFKNKNSKGYSYMTKMLDTAFKNGKLTPLTLPAEFKSECKRSDSFAEKFNAVFGVIKAEKQWMSKLGECRNLVAEQLGALALSLENESKRCRMKIDSCTEETLWAEFDKTKLYPEKIVAEKYPGGNFCISVYIPCNRIESSMEEKLEKIVSKVAGCSLVCSDPKCEGNSYIYCFYPSKKFMVLTGSASCSKENEKVSGDSFSIVKGDRACVNIILSDGMGSGQGAAQESARVIELTKSFLNAGVESPIAVKLVNSSLLFHSVRDSFSTIDLCTINLADADFEITKLGAAKSYIKRGNDISCIKPGSLPAGILMEIDAETHHFSIDSDTVIVLMSDGIADIELKYPQFEGWIEKELQKINTSNPQIVATKLVEKATSFLGEKVYDDMTVVVASIQKV